MRHFTVITFLVFSLTNLFGQDSTLEKSIKINTNFAIDPIQSVISSSWGITTFNIKRISFSLMLAKSRHFHELELSELFIDNSISEEYYIDSLGNVDLISRTKLSEFSIGLRYSFNILLLKRKNFSCFMGVSADPIFSTASNKNLFGESVFPTSMKDFSIPISLVPRMQYSATNRFFFDLSIPYSIIDLGINSTTTENPQIPVQNQTNTNFQVDTLSLYFRIQLGFGIKS